MRIQTEKLSLLVSVLVLAFSLSGCLKTRAQLREEALDESEPMSRRQIASTVTQAPQPVEPRGQAYAIDEIKAEFTQLVGRVEDLERSLKESGDDQDQLEKLKQALKAESKRIDAKFADLEKMLQGLQEATNKMAEGLQKVLTHPVLTDPNEVFKRASTLFEEENYPAAAESYGEYIKLPKVKRLEEAVFMRGESFYLAKQFKKAIVEYSKFPEKFPKSSRLPSALFKIGLSFEGLNMSEDAKGFFQEVVAKFPKSIEAKKAKKKIK